MVAIWRHARDGSSFVLNWFRWYLFTYLLHIIQLSITALLFHLISSIYTSIFSFLLDLIFSIHLYITFLLISTTYRSISCLYTYFISTIHLSMSSLLTYHITLISLSISSILIFATFSSYPSSISLQYISLYLLKSKYLSTLLWLTVDTQFSSQFAASWVVS